MVDDGEKGAFKIANSWGNLWSNSGYSWILYDALLSTSRIKSANNSSVTWDAALSTERIPFFRWNSHNNRFYYMTISDYDVGYVSEVYINTNRRNQLTASANNNSVLHDIYKHQGSNDTEISFWGKIVLNHKTSNNNIEASLSGSTWGVRIADLSNDAYSITGISCRILDNLGNQIKSYYSGGNINGSYITPSTSINLVRGDVDYVNGLTIDDADLLLDYIAHNVTFSNVQKELADYNNNGVVDVTDYSLLVIQLTSKGLDVSSLEAKYNDYCQRGLLSKE